MKLQFLPKVEQYGANWVMLMRRNGSSQNPLYLVVGGLQWMARHRECKPWQWEKRLQGQAADPRDWEGSTCRNHSASKWVLPLLWHLCSIRELEDVCPWKNHWECQ